MDYLCLFIVIFGLGGPAGFALAYMILDTRFDDEARVIFDAEGTSVVAKLGFIKRAYIKHQGDWVNPVTGREAPMMLRVRFDRLLSMRKESAK